MGNERDVQVITIRSFTPSAAASLLARLALAAVAVSAAVYLLPSSISIVAWPESGPVRLAVLPPLSRLWLALGGGALTIDMSIWIWLRMRPAI